MNFRVEDRENFKRYFLGLDSSGFNLGKQEADKLKIVLKGNSIQMYLNDTLHIQYYDDEAITNGKIAFETIEGAEIDFDDIQVIGVDSFKPLEGYNWYRTGGPIGGLGYIRIHPEDKNIMFVTDNPSGVNKVRMGGKAGNRKMAGSSSEQVLLMKLSQYFH